MHDAAFRQLKNRFWTQLVQGSDGAVLGRSGKGGFGGLFAYVPVRGFFAPAQPLTRQAAPGAFRRRTGGVGRIQGSAAHKHLAQPFGWGCLRGLCTTWVARDVLWIFRMPRNLVLPAPAALPCAGFCRRPVGPSMSRFGRCVLP